MNSTLRGSRARFIFYHFIFGHGKIFFYLVITYLILIFPSKSNAQSVAAGSNYSLFQCGNGTGKACGYNDHGQLADTNSTPWVNHPRPVIGITGIKKISGGNPTLFLLDDSTVWMCGYNWAGLYNLIPVQIAGLSGIIDIAASGGFSLFLKNDSTVWVAGDNSLGQLGDGTNTNRTSPVQLSSLSGIAAISASYGHSLFLKNDGTAWASGYNQYGQLGNGTFINSNIPIQVSGLTNIMKMGYGKYSSFFINNNGDVWACGSNGIGQLGIGLTTITHDSIAMPVPGITNVTVVAAGDIHTLFLKNDGTVWGCGINGNGQLGDTTITNILYAPVQLNGLTGITHIAAGDNCSFFLKNNATVWSCGVNSYGNLGDGTNTFEYLTPVQMIGTSGITDISASQSSTFLLDNNSLAWACGQNLTGELGIGTAVQRNLPVDVSSPSDIIQVSAGYFTSLFLKSDGTVWASGDNGTGQTGTLPNYRPTSPTKIDSLSNIVAISTSGDHSLFLKNDGTAYGCGSDVHGQLGVGDSGTYTLPKRTPVKITSLSGITAIAAGLQHSFFLRSDGTVYACGMNNSGELGDGTTASKNIPFQVPGLSDVVAISANSQSLFLKSDGTVWACGANTNGQLGLGAGTFLVPTVIPGLSQVISISAGLNFSLFVKSDGTAWATGYNGYGQLGNGTTTQTYIPVQVHNLTGISLSCCGGYHSIFVKNDGTVWSCGRNYNGQLGNGTQIDSYLPVQVQNLCYVNAFPDHPHILSGYTYSDSSLDCILQNAEQRIPFFPIVSTPSLHYTCSNDTGYYRLGLDNSTYYITPVISQYMSQFISNPCPLGYSVSLNAGTPHDTSGFDFGFHYAPCFLLRVDISGNRKRRCAKNLTTVRYFNDGIAAADSVTVHVKFDQYDIPVSASGSYTVDPSDSSIVFYIGHLDPWETGSIQIIDSIACVAGISGLTQCSKAWILPVNQCLIDSTTGIGWDHSSIVVSGNCVNDTIRFVIYNSGNSMLTTSEYRIYFDNAHTQTANFQLTAGDSLVVNIVSGGATVRLEADQNPGHPGRSHPRSTLEACGLSATGTFSIGQVNAVPQDDEDIDIEIDCMQIRAAYDPNEKDNSPEGIGAQQIVLQNSPVDFTIHFQNTGTDTASKVIIKDTLSNDLDLSTLESGASSHPYSISIDGQGIAVLKFTFNNINLVDSATDEINSIGFVKYKIAPKTGTPLGTRINNTADIYFDYNFPIRTNTAFITLGSYLILPVMNSTPVKSNEIIIYPNPSSGKFIFESSKEDPIEKIIVFSSDGRKLKEQAVGKNSGVITIDLTDVAQGIYLVNCISKKQCQKVSIIKQ